MADSILNNEKILEKIVGTNYAPTLNPAQPQSVKLPKFPLSNLIRDVQNILEGQIDANSVPKALTNLIEETFAKFSNTNDKKEQVKIVGAIINIIKEQVELAAREKNIEQQKIEAALSTLNRYSSALAEELKAQVDAHTSQAAINNIAQTLADKEKQKELKSRSNSTIS
jgi:hypothetical protein